MMAELPFNPDWTVHPGELVEMFMEDLGIDSAELAKRMGVDIRYVENLLEAREDTTVGSTTAKMLGKAFDMPAKFWLNSEARYRKDLIRLTPKRVGLFENHKSFVRIAGKEGEALANKFVEDFLTTGTEWDQQLAAALNDVTDFVVLAEHYEGRMFFEFLIDYGEGTYMAFGPNLVSVLLANSLPVTTRLPRKDASPWPAIIYEEESSLGFALASATV